MKKPSGLTVLTWVAIALAVGAVLAEGIGLREAGRNLREQEQRPAGPPVGP